MQRLDTEIGSYFDEIAAALAARGALKDDFDRDVETHECRYVLRMCEKLAVKIGRPGITAHEVMRAERSASGHVDYQRKFAFYCYELSVGR